VLRGAASTGFRAPGLAQSYFSHTTTNVIGGQFIEVVTTRWTNRASQIFGAKPLKEETSVNLSAGFAFTPSDNFTFTVDVFNIKINDRILLGATFVTRCRSGFSRTPASPRSARCSSSPTGSTPGPTAST